MGDMILSKPFCKEIIRHIKPDEVFYANGSPIIEDLAPHYPHPEKDINPFLEHYLHIDGDEMWVNCWFAPLTKNIPDLKPVSDNNSWCLFEDTWQKHNYFCKKELGFNLDYMRNASYRFFWPVDKEKYPLYKNVPIWEKKRVLIYNQKTMTSGIPNVTMRKFIKSAATLYPNVGFYLTSKTDVDNPEEYWGPKGTPMDITLPNVFYLPDYYEGKTFDLFETSCFSTKCDIILGPVSGPYMSSWTQENLSNSIKTFISIQNASFGHSMLSGQQQARSWYTRNTVDAFMVLDKLLKSGI